MRIGVVGTVEATVAGLEALRQLGCDPVALFTLDEKEGRKRHGDWADCSGGMDSSDVWVNPADGDLAFGIRERGIEALLVLGWSRMIPSEILTMPRLGCFGWHPSLLPKGRGRHAITWQILEQATESGLTLFRLTERVDAGPIMAQVRFDLSPQETARTFYEKVKAAAYPLLKEALVWIGGGHIYGMPQDDAAATVYEKRLPMDNRLRANDPEFNERLIRACGEPYGGICA